MTLINIKKIAAQRPAPFLLSSACAVSAKISQCQSIIHRSSAGACELSARGHFRPFPFGSLVTHQPQIALLPFVCVKHFCRNAHLRDVNGRRGGGRKKSEKLGDESEGRHKQRKKLRLSQL